MTERGVWLGQIKDTQLSERYAVLTSLVSGILKAKLLMSESDELPLDKSYFELGLTSLGAVELQEELEMSIDRRIDATNLYNNPTVKNLVMHIRDSALSEYFTNHDSDNQTDASMVYVPNRQNDYVTSAKNLLDEMLNDL